MRRYRIDSSAIRSVGYDEASRTLELEFGSGAVYDYDGVPPEEVLALLEAESRGHYFEEHIRGPYPYRRVA
ncbi:MAG: KTSC domain-containing protein [Amnibacterium sp.]